MLLPLLMCEACDGADVCNDRCRHRGRLSVARCMSHVSDEGAGRCTTRKQQDQVITQSQYMESLDGRGADATAAGREESRKTMVSLSLSLCLPDDGASTQRLPLPSLSS